MKNFGRFLVLVFVLASISCARFGRVQGGAKDVDPPVYMGAEPENLTRNVPTDIKEIRIYFDEYITLKDMFNQLLISPPIEPQPLIEPQGSPKKYIRIRFNDSLQANTTYNFNFGQSLVDFNESNPFSFFSYVFSTGESIDSLELTGKVSGLTERKIPENVVVALYKIDTAYSDSAALKSKPYYLSKLDSTNRFNLNYLAEGKYRMLSYNDETSNLIYDPAVELVSFFSDTLVLPQDSVDYQLKLFKGKAPYRLKGIEQEGFGKAYIELEGQPESVQIQSIDHDFKSLRVVHKSRSDTVELWFNPLEEEFEGKNPKLSFQIEHKESLDTLTMIYDTQPKPKLTIEKQSAALYPESKFTLNSNYLLKEFNPDSIAIFKDTLSFPTRIDPLDSINPRQLHFNFPVEFESKYEIVMLPGAVRDFFGNTNDSLSFNVNTGKKSDLGKLTLNLQNPPKQDFFLELYDDRDSKLSRIVAKAGEKEFVYPYLRPGKVYFKLYVDDNENGFWDTGDFINNIQPEKVYLYPELIEIRAFWELNETWVLPTGD